MAQDFLKSFDKNIKVHSAGKFPVAIVNPGVFEGMAELGLISARIR
jgi:protein-tyrosine-phosphatase